MLVSSWDLSGGVELSVNIAKRANDVDFSFDFWIEGVLSKFDHNDEDDDDDNVGGGGEGDTLSFGAWIEEEVVLSKFDHDDDDERLEVDAVFILFHDEFDCDGGQFSSWSQEGATIRGFRNGRAFLWTVVATGRKRLRDMAIDDVVVVVVDVKDFTWRGVISDTR